MDKLGISVAFILAAGALAGCLSGDDSDDARDPTRMGPDFDPRWAERAVPWGDGHDHSDIGQHTGLSTRNFELVGWDPLPSPHYGRTMGGYGCSNTVADGDRVLSVTNSFTTASGLLVSDVSDPADPKFLGELVLENTHIYDNALSPDLEHAVLATSAYEDGPDIVSVPPLRGPVVAGPGGAWFQDHCSGERSAVEGPVDLLPFYTGVVLVDLSDPTVPAVADYLPLPASGAHSVRVFDVHGQDIIIASVAGNAGVDSYWIFIEILDTPTGGKLLPRGAFYPPERFTMNPQDHIVDAGTHDGWVEVHPITGQYIAYLADLFDGAWIVNVDDVSQPELLSYIDVESYFGGNMIVHGLQPALDTWDGRHYTVGHQECGGRSDAYPSCIVWIMDTTDPSDPLVISAWTIPVELTWSGGLQFSIHYTGLYNRTLFATSYHGGIWAIDLSTREALLEPKTIGVYIPDQAPDGGPEITNDIIRTLLGSLFDNYPLIIDLDVLADGTIVAYDANTGLYTLRFDATDPAPPPAPWPIDAPFDAAPEGEP